jgi:hypothetical protein
MKENKNVMTVELPTKLVGGGWGKLFNDFNMLQANS